MRLVIKNRLDHLKVGQFIDKKATVKELYGKANDVNLTRVFDVQLCHAKKLMPGKKFKTYTNRIFRIE